MLMIQRAIVSITVVLGFPLMIPMSVSLHAHLLTSKTLSHLNVSSIVSMLLLPTTRSSPTQTEDVIRIVLLVSLETYLVFHAWIFVLLLLPLMLILLLAIVLRYVPPCMPTSKRESVYRSALVECLLKIQQGNVFINASMALTPMEIVLWQCHFV